MKKIKSTFLTENGFSINVDHNTPYYQRNGYMLMSDNGIWLPCRISGGDVVIGELYLNTEEDLIKNFEEVTGNKF